MNKIVRRILSALIPARYKPVTVFPYPYKGSPLPVAVGKGPCGLPFAEHAGIRVFFPEWYSEAHAEWWFRNYLEDEGLTGQGRRTKSPHCYVTAEHRPQRGDVIVDLGCAEGFFSRHFADLAKKIYLIEADEKWELPVCETFAGFSNKTVFVRKLVGAVSDDVSVRLEDVLAGSDPQETYFIKMDIEGGERTVIEASADFLRSHRVKLSCCAYHRQDDAKVLSKMLASMGFTISYSDGWMLPYNSREFPYFRKAMIYARNY